MILGTVQLGLNYGINNKAGKPSSEEAMNILDCAYNNGIRVLDTASAYGASESIIGQYIKKTGNTFKICTKMIPDGENGADEIVSKSIRALNIENIYVYYLHRFEDCKNVDIIMRLNMLKEAGIIENIGISIYEPEELEYILNNLSGQIDVVQIPFNLFDNARWKKDNLLDRARASAVKIFARSVLLQGLFFLPKDDNFIKKINAQEFIEKINIVSEDKQIELARLALAYVKSQKYISDYVIGCEKLQQLIENINLDSSINNNILSQQDLAYIEAMSVDISEDIIDPRKWKVN